MGAAFIAPLVGAFASAAFSKVFGGGEKKEQAAPAPVAAPDVKPPQAPAAPSVGAFMGANQSASAVGPMSTQLSGPGGIDPTTLKLGKNTILGA